MVTDEEMAAVAKAIEAKSIIGTFDLLNRTCVELKPFQGQGFLTVCAHGEGWSTQLVLCGPN